MKPEAYAIDEVLRVKMRYKHPRADNSRIASVTVSDQHQPLDAASANFKFAAAVAEFGLLLRDSKFKAQASHDNCLTLARQAVGEDKDGYRKEFLLLVERSKNLPRRDG